MRRKLELTFAEPVIQDLANISPVVMVEINGANSERMMSRMVSFSREPVLCAHL
jgi:hypothetical protein